MAKFIQANITVRGESLNLRHGIVPSERVFSTAGDIITKKVSFL